LQLLQSAEQLRIVPLKDPSKGDPNACMILLGKDAAELLAPLWDVRSFESYSYQKFNFNRLCFDLLQILMSPTCVLLFWRACAAQYVSVFLIDNFVFSLYAYFVIICESASHIFFRFRL
jgi:hypothetical protein